MVDGFLPDVLAPTRRIQWGGCIAVRARPLLRIAVVVLAAGTLGSCGLNQIRIGYAGDVAAKGKVAAAASRDFLVTVDQTRIAANLDLIAMDPACAPLQTYVRRQPDLRAFKDPANPPRGWLCATAAVKDVTYDQPFSLAPLGGDLEPTFVLIDALGAYASGLAAIVDEKGDDPIGDLTDALALVRSAEGLLDSLSGAAPVVPSADDKRLAAIKGFAQFLVDLQNEKTKADKLKKYVESQGSADTIRALRDHLSAWELSRRSDANLRFVLAAVLINGAQAADPPLPAERRRAIAKNYYDRAAARVSSAKLKPAIDAVLVELGAADDDLRRVLHDKPNLTAAERARLAEITRERIGKAFDLLTALVTSFKA